MCFYDGAGTQSLILTCHRNRRISLFNSKNQTTIDLFDIVGGEDVIKGIQATTDGTKIITGLESGEISIWDASNLIELSSKNIVTNLNSWSCGNQINAIRLNSFDENLLATGGIENPLKVWDLNVEKEIFTAKNVIFFSFYKLFLIFKVRHDFLELRVPICESNMRFFGNNGKCIVTTTRKHQVCFLNFL